MNQTTSTVAATKVNRRFILEMRGFSDAEKSMLASTFRLTSRREMSYVEPGEGDQRADIYLINADSPEAIAAMVKQDADATNLRVPNPHTPAVLIGRTAVESAWPFVAKPIHWMRLFECLDEEMKGALRERSLRAPAAKASWDGKTYRRLCDKEAEEVEEVQENFTPVRESVLVVDDSATVRAFMRIKLSDFEFDVDFAESGEQAIEKAKDKTYTCVFLDIMMPGIDGYEVCKRIKSKKGSKNSAVVMLTSKSSMIDKLRANWSGCDAFLSKPVSEDDLLATIAKFLPSARDSVKD